MYVIIEHDGERFAVWPGTGTRPISSRDCQKASHS